MTDFTGRMLGQYEVVEEIGRGGMATVYKGHQPSTNRYVAIKVLPPQFTHDETFIQRFRQEAQVIAQLEHQSILPIYDVGQEGHTPYIVMRYIDGGTLHDLIRARVLALADVRRILTQVASALDYAHERHVVHRDLKPRNILVDRQGNAYLSDFGIAKLIEATMELTGTGVMGTPAYIAPEAAQGFKPDRRADVYALGIVAYEMLTGQVPYEADTPMGVIFKHVNEPVPSVRDAVPDVPPAVDEAVRQALAKEPDRRYQTAGAFARAFAGAVGEVERGDSGFTMPVREEAAYDPTTLPLGVDSPPRPAPPVAKTPPPPATTKRGVPTWLIIVAGAVVQLMACLCLLARIAQNQ